MKKILYILRGCPGSGKSTWAKKHREEYMNGNCRYVKIISADDYFIRPDGFYDWSPKTISNAHQWCRTLAEQHMEAITSIGCGMLIVDNTNIKRKDFKAYIDMANKYGFEVVEKAFGEFTEEAIKLYAERNIHRVPLETIKRMADTLKVSLGLEDIRETPFTHYVEGRMENPEFAKAYLEMKEELKEDKNG